MTILSETCGTIVEKLGWDDPSTTLAQLIQNLSQAGYNLDAERVSIHSEKSIQFMNKVIEAEPWVLQVLKEGVRLEFFRAPPVEYIC